ncbi:MAG TPA: tetratricopeptide repeat protein [Phycisphaerales bacterium]|nr:tetratricopeptide repeat protein [Phycisphaerales bacterium]
MTQPRFTIRICQVFVFALIVPLIAGCDRGRNSAAPSATSRPDQAGDAPARESIDAALNAAQQYINSSDLPKAKAILLRLVEKAPNESHAHELLGQVYGFEAAKPPENAPQADPRQLMQQAADEYAKAVELAPKSAGLAQSAGMMALSAGRTDQALKYFHTAAEIDPANPQPILFSAQVLMQKKDFAGAKSLLDDLLKRDADEPYAIASLAVIALEQNDSAKAIELAGQAREIAPDDVNIRVQEARIHRRVGNPQHAVELLAALSEEDRQKFAVADELARAFTAIGEHAKAKDALQLALLHIEPASDAWRVYVRLGETGLAAGKMDDARFWLEQAEARRPNAAEVVALRDAVNAVFKGL